MHKNLALKDTSTHTYTHDEYRCCMLELFEYAVPYCDVFVAPAA